jgi:hypothetical protein
VRGKIAAFAPLSCQPRKKSGTRLSPSLYPPSSPHPILFLPWVLSFALPKTPSSPIKNTSILFLSRSPPMRKLSERGNVLSSPPLHASPCFSLPPTSRSSIGRLIGSVVISSPSPSRPRTPTAMGFRRMPHTPSHPSTPVFVAPRPLFSEVPILPVVPMEILGLQNLDNLLPDRQYLTTWPSAGWSESPLFLPLTFVERLFRIRSCYVILANDVMAFVSPTSMSLFA